MDKRQVGPFELERKLGVGGMGIVYLARYLKTGQHVAVKVLSPDLMTDEKVAKRFEREMAILKKLKHPHIVQYYGGSTSGSQRFYAMELVKGGSLEQLLKKKGPVSWEQAIEYGLQITKALEHAHSVGVIHRDLKPANLLLTSKGVIKLSDFGIARDTQSTALTAAGKTVGTMSYMAPEQITGKHPISAKTDLYAFGCVLFELLTGRTPFLSETAPEMLFKHLDEDPPSVREYNIDVPIWLDQLISELMEKDPQERPFDALAVQVKLEEVKQLVAERKSITQQTAAGGTTLKEGDAAVTKLFSGPAKKRKRKKKDQAPFYERVWFLATALVAVIGVLVWGFWPKSEEERFQAIHAVVSKLEPSEWHRSKSELDDYLADFDTGGEMGEARQQHIAQVREWADNVDMIREENKAEQREKSGRDPESQAERQYMEARQFERFGDRLTALQKYEAMQPLFENDAKARPFVNLARRQARKIKDGIGGENDPVKFVQEQIAAADRLFFEDRKLQAQNRWQSIVNLYQNSGEHQDQVRRARARLISPEETLMREYVENPPPSELEPVTERPATETPQLAPP
ncbi:MAG: serine/threonine protein kinase [Planctomycetaceae bacterium]|nr:serine/threonine protein kinase [Planctomycetaceae bacterium]